MVIRGIDYQESDIQTVVRQTYSWLMKLHQDCHHETVDFDILAVFIMQEMEEHLHIRHLVDILIETFSQSQKPQTSRHQQLLEASLMVKKTISSYDENIKTQPGLVKPFCLRFPTLSDVLDHTIILEAQCRILYGSRMQVLLDENGICVGVGLPPFPGPAEGSVHVPHDVRFILLN